MGGNAFDVKGYADPAPPPSTPYPDMSTGVHPSTFEYLKPTDEQVEQMARVRAAAKAYCDVLEAELPNGPDKTFIIRNHRSNAMWANVAITREADGTPRDTPNPF